MGAKPLNLKGKIINDIEIIELDGKAKSGDNLWKCKCVCGKLFKTTASSLNSGVRKSCGCLKIINTKKANTRHGKRNEKIYAVWKTMRARCRNKNNQKYKNYGGRGITICDEWNDFSAFYNWAMENGYQHGLTIDRINVNGNYEPDNCRWVTNSEQSRNKTNNRFLIYNNQKKCISDWAREIGISRKSIAYRLNKGWSVEKALTTPARKKVIN